MRTLLFVAALLTPIAALADEGMWLPEQLPELAPELRSLGLELDPSALADLHAHPLGAVISLGGCSASFVSPDGLVVTNHHCAVRALQHNSTSERNLLEQGFAPESRDDEVWAGPGSRVYVTQSLDDVTERVLGAVPEGASDVERYDAIDDAIKTLVRECEAPGGLRCSVPAYHGGASYRLVQQLEIEDVRIAYAPPAMIGFYGGDEDNWMWPRHTGDFAFFRAYVTPDGTPGPYAEDNVPYTPEHHLEIRSAELDAGDFVMVAGYPGRTNRQRTGDEMARAKDVTYPWNIQTMADMIAILEAAGEADPEAAVRSQSFKFSLSNYLKNNRGMLDGFQDSGAVERALARDANVRQALAERADADPDAARSIAALDELQRVLDAGRVHADRDALLGWMNWGVDLLSVANTALWLAHEREKPDAERERGYQERDLPQIAERVARIDNNWHADVNARMLAYFMERLDALDDPTTEPAVALFLSFGGGEDYLAAARAMLETTRLVDAQERAATLDVTVIDIEAARDPFLQLASALYPVRRAARDEAREREGAYSRLRPQYIAAVQDNVSGPIYPDANSTLRVTYGQIRGYEGPDAVWFRPFTTVRGILEKHTGEAPFDAPQALRDAIASQEWGSYEDVELGAVPVNFLSTLDTTGGNSGSVTLDAQGRLCGLLFDGNYEAMASDWVFDPIATRSIHVSAVYMLWVMDRVYGQHRILRELGISPHFDR